MQSKLEHVPWDIVAWLLDGEMVEGTSLDAIKLKLSRYQVDSSKYANRGLPDDPRKNAHSKTRGEFIKEREKEFTSGARKPHEKFNKFNELYQLAVTSDIEKLKSVARN